MNAKIEAQAASMIRLIADRLPHAREELAELISTSMALAFCEGELNGIRQAQACIETTRAMEKARTA
jgi:hypothetical protein